MNEPVFPMRAVMLDLGRVIEKKSYYASLLPWLAEWGYNVVHLHLADDQRCALRFPSRPELASPGAYTADEMREFIALAGRHGLAVMPEVETLGHSEFITEHPRYRQLTEPLPDKMGYNAICPSHPETREVISDLLRDAAAIFDHPVIHVGLDEVRFGACPRCRRKSGRAQPDWERFAEHSAWVHGEVRRLGRRPGMWADHAVKQTGMLKRFKRDVLMFHWDYTVEYRPARMQLLLDAGFEAVACPSTLCSTSRIVPNTAVNLKNLRNASARSAHVLGRGVVGFDNTVWCPWRYLPGAIDFGLAFAGHQACARAEEPRFAERFVRRFYDVPSPRRLAAALLALHDLGPDNNLFDRIVYGIDGLGTPFNREDRRVCALLVPQISGVLSVLAREDGKVRRNRDRFGDLLFSAEAILAVFRFGAAGRKKSAVRGARSLFLRAERAWARDRTAGDRLRFGDPHHGQDSLWRALRSLC
jgi:hypothetical protein